MRRGLLGVLLLALVAWPVLAQESGLAVGTRAPLVTVHDLEGKLVDLGRWIGRKPVLLEWWATWCEECDALLPRLKAARAAVGDSVAFVAVNVAVNQSRDKVRRFVAKEQVPFVVLYDDEGASTRAYQAPATSYVVIVDRSGKVAYTGVGGDQPFLEALQQVIAP